MLEKDIEETFKIESMKDAVLIGNEDERKDYYPAIISIDIEKGIITYDYEILVECFMKKFMESDNISMDDAYVQAEEWVDYNVIRSLPYMGEHAPKIFSDY